MSGLVTWAGRGVLRGTVVAYEQPDHASAADAGGRLAAALRTLHDGDGGGVEVIRAFRESRVFVLADGAGVRSVDHGGLRWVLAFSGEAAVRTYLTARGEQPVGPVNYLAMYGRRLLDDFLPAADLPAGVALDLGAERPMLIPPVREAAGKETPA